MDRGPFVCNVDFRYDSPSCPSGHYLMRGLQCKHAFTTSNKVQHITCAYDKKMSKLM